MLFIRKFYVDDVTSYDSSDVEQWGRYHDDELTMMMMIIIIINYVAVVLLS